MSIWPETFMSMVVRVFDQRLLMSMIVEYLVRGCLRVYLVRDSFMSIRVQVFSQRLFHEHDSASIWPEALSRG